MNFKFGKRKAKFGKPNFNYKDKTKAERLRWLTVPIDHKISLKELDMIIPLNKGKISDVFYDKDGHRNTHVLPSIPVDRSPESIAVQLFDRPDAAGIEIEGGKVTNITVLAGDTKNEISLKYKIKFDLPSDRDLRSRLINCMGEDIQISLKNTQAEAFAEDEPEDDEAQADLDKPAKKAEKEKAGATPPTSVQ